MKVKVNPYKRSHINMSRDKNKDVIKWEHVISAETTVSRPTTVKSAEKPSVYSVVHPIRRHATTASLRVAVAVLLDS